MNLLIRRGTTYARVNWSRWLADCAGPYCRSALQLPRGWPAFECWECGEMCEVVWPAPGFVTGVERLLLMRPDPHTRNWEPGESLHDLLQENLMHGILPASRADLEAHPGGVLLAIVDDAIVHDTLPAAPPRREIGA